MKKLIESTLTNLLVFALLSLLLMVMWNLLLPTIFGLPKISFMQALGLKILSTILFKHVPHIKED